MAHREYSQLVELLGSGLLVCVVGMTLTWWAARRINNYSIVDAVWAFGFTAMAGLFAVSGSGWLPRRWVLLGVVGAWSVRLGSYLTHRIRSHHPIEDGRYVELRKSYAPHIGRGFFRFFQYQAVSIVVLSVPFALVAGAQAPAFSMLEHWGILIAIGSLGGEALADAQLFRFKSDARNKGRTCDVGVWKFSRHPNYFFEFCIWVGFFIFAVGATVSDGSWLGLFTVYCPATILALLLKVTGIPLAEAQSLQSRGEEYRRYQQRTSRFIPWFPRKPLLLAFVGWMVASLAAGAHTASAKDAAKLRSQTIRIYALGHVSTEPAFVQTTQWSEVKTGVIRRVSEIKDSGGKVVLTEDAEYSGDRLIRQSVRQIQTGEAYEVVVMPETSKVRFQQFKIRGGADVPLGPAFKDEQVDLTPDFVTGPTAAPYIQKNWDILASGKTVSARFGVLEISDTVGFKFTRVGTETIDGKNLVVIRMQPSNFFVALAVSHIDLFFDAQTRQMVRYRGRTPLKSYAHGNESPFDAEIVYSDLRP